MKNFLTTPTKEVKLTIVDNRNDAQWFGDRWKVDPRIDGIYVGVQKSGFRFWAVWNAKHQVGKKLRQKERERRRREKNPGGTEEIVWKAKVRL